MGHTLGAICMFDRIFFVKGDVPSQKNSKIYNAKRRRAFPSKACSKYIRDSENDYRKITYKLLGYIEGDGCQKNTYKGGVCIGGEVYQKVYQKVLNNLPVYMQLLFARRTKRKFDFDNMTATVLDRLVQHGIIVDDNVDIILPIPSNPAYILDKENPGVYIKFIRQENYPYDLTKELVL